MEKELKITQDGSATFYVPALDEHYHSVHGALNESLHVFIRNGYLAFEGNDVSIFEMGLGTGLNALLTILEANRINRKTVYYALEKYPVENHFIAQLNYQGMTGHPGAAKMLEQIHEAPWEQEVDIGPYFRLTKLRGDIKEGIPDCSVHIVYFDAFAPEKQPSLWTAGVFEKMYKIMHPGGLLTTYCAKGAVRRTMEQVGFRVERLQGPPGKREMLRAAKPVIHY